MSSPAVPIFNWLEIETQGDCNRRCVTCLRQSYPDKDNPTHQGRMPVTSQIGIGKQMPIDTYKSIIDQSIDLGFNGTVNLQHYNEPLLDDRLEDLAEYAQSKNVYQVGAFTNMDLLTEERAKRLDEVFDFLTVALYMPLKKQKVKEEWIKSLFKNTKLDFTKGIHLTTHYSPAVSKPLMRELIDTHVEETCTYYSQMLIIGYDGTVLHCCDDYVGHFGLGNVHTASIKEIWENEVHRKLVNDLSKPGGRKNYEFCKTCPRPA